MVAVSALPAQLGEEEKEEGMLLPDKEWEHQKKQKEEDWWSIPQWPLGEKKVRNVKSNLQRVVS
eukprot:12418833-Karenia_brevis.AAC.1